MLFQPDNGASQSLLDRTVDVFLPRLAEGLVLTVELTVLGIPLTILVALVTGLMRTGGNRLVRGSARVFVDFFRSTSLVVQLFWMYFALNQVLSLNFGFQLSALGAGVIAIGLNYGSYASEIVRGSIQAVPKAQWEATIALNMTPFQRMRRVILPQAVPLMLPSFGNTVVELLKGTSLVSLIALADLAKQGDDLRGQFENDSWLIFGMLLVIYFVLAHLMTLGMRFMERRANASIGRQSPPPGLRRARAKAKTPTAGV